MICNDIQTTPVGQLALLPRGYTYAAQVCVCVRECFRRVYHAVQLYLSKWHALARAINIKLPDPSLLFSFMLAVPLDRPTQMSALHFDASEMNGFTQSVRQVQSCCCSLIG